jgi:PST family polysaccharide transporter
MSEAAQIQAKAARGAGWSIVLGMGSRVITLVGSIVITHWIAPDVMGEVGVAIIVVMMLNTFTTIGVGHYMLSKHDEGRATIWHLTLLHVVTGILALGLGLAFVHPLAKWMKSPDLPRYLPWLVAMGLMDRVLFIPERVLLRAMQLRRVALMRSIGELAYGVAAVTLAFAGFGGWAVIIANLARSGLKLVMFASVAPRAEWLEPHKLSYAKYKEIFAFGGPLMLGYIAYYASSRFDNLIVSMLYGPAVMGQYNVAYNLASVPADQIGEQAEEALLPALSRVTREERPNVLGYSVGMLSLIVFPVAVGLGMVATTAAQLFIGPKWGDVGPMMSILCFLSIARPLSMQIHGYMLAEGRPRSLLLIELGKLAAVVGLLFTLGRVSPHWACVAVGIAYVAHAIVAQILAARVGSFPLWKLFIQYARPLAACVTLAAGVLGARYALAGLHVKGVSFVGEIVGGAVGYVLGAFLIARSQVQDLLSLVRSRKRTAPAAA